MEQTTAARPDGRFVVADDAPSLYHGLLAWNPVPECKGEKRVAVAQAVAAEEIRLQKEITDTRAQVHSPRRAQRLAALRRKVPCSTGRRVPVLLKARARDLLA
ncbi:MAG: hypothetical protein ACREJ2_14360, partial [Planctomycetota bacterium]